MPTTTEPLRLSTRGLRDYPTNEPAASLSGIFTIEMLRPVLYWLEQGAASQSSTPEEAKPHAP